MASAIWNCKVIAESGDTQGSCDADSRSRSVLERRDSKFLIHEQSVADSLYKRQESVGARFQAVREHTRRICSTLEPEDCVIQSMPDVSPIRWHLAHTTWFFETFVLKKFVNYQSTFHNYEFLFNSYYNAVGHQFPRDRRGLLSRPTVSEVLDYRQQIDDRVIELLYSQSQWPEALLETIELGLHHEQQHQELMLTDIKHVFSCNPLFPAHVTGAIAESTPPRQEWLEYDAGLHEIGHEGIDFSFDNESPRHRVFVESFQLSNRLVTNGEFLEFVEGGGYRRSESWLSLGWNHVNQNAWGSPLYWLHQDAQWFEFTLGGLKQLDLSLPITHVSYFEADAYARWACARLPTEAEWEIASQENTSCRMAAEDYFDSGRPVHPTHCGDDCNFDSLFGSTWQWTSSSYSPYPGYLPPAGALGEYNGKFMCNQYVLRGSSCATARGHSRQSYRNFFPPDAQWQFTGIRLAKPRQPVVT